MMSRRTWDRAGAPLRLTISNHARQAREFGVAYRLERWRGGEWRWLNQDAAFILIAKVIQPGGRQQERLALPDDLPPGRYRIVKSFRAPGSSREQDAEARFSVVEPG